MAKGSGFERYICKLLSKWWTDGKRDDVFWRTAGSGARATIRSKTKKKTFGQYGDIQATDPIGQPLTDLCTIEIKRGYSKSTFADLIEDSTVANAKPCMYAQFIQQAKEDARKAGVPYWLLIIKRDRRKEMVIIPHNFSRVLARAICPLKTRPNVCIQTRKAKYFITSLDNFLFDISPKDIHRITNETKK